MPTWDLNEAESHRSDILLIYLEISVMSASEDTILLLEFHYLYVCFSVSRLLTPGNTWMLLYNLAATNDVK